LGWNEIEYGLSENFITAAGRIEEQIEVLLGSGRNRW
jgi:hypothetical protein